MFEVPNYLSVFACLTIWREPEKFEVSGDRRIRSSSLLVKGQRAVNECSLLTHEFEGDQYAARYFGRIECLEKGLDHTPHNPRILIDPNRQSGLVREHPFTKALFQIPSERLRALIAKDRKSERSLRREIANQETERRLDRLAKAASQFMKQQLDDLAELTAGEAVDTRAFSKSAVMLYPTFVRLALGEEKTLWMYVSSELVHSQNVKAHVQKDSDDLTILDPVFQLLPHSKREDRLVGKFQIHADNLSDGVYVHAKVDSLPPAEAIVEIVECGFEEREFVKPLEFEYGQYKVRQGSTRTVRLYALFPDLVSKETPAKVWSDDSVSVLVSEPNTIVPVADSNFARSDITVKGRRLNAKVDIRALVNGREASTVVSVIEKDQRGVPLKFELRDEDYHNFRARWADHEGKPNLLLVSARHKSLKRYLGPEPDFEGQNSPVFRLLLSEIIAESVYRKILGLEAKERPWDFRLADLKYDWVIVDTVLARLHRQIRDFVTDAHAIMLSNEELENLSNATTHVT